MERQDIAEWLDRVCAGDPAGRLGTQGMEGWLSCGLPFSFRYSGRDSADLMPRWRRKVGTATRSERTVRTVVVTDPETGLEVTWEATTCDDVPAVEWIVHFRNGGAADTPILSNVRAIDLVMATDYHELIVHHATGGIAAPDAFEPLQTSLYRPGGRAPGATGQAGQTEFRLASTGGRSSNGPLPYFNVEANWGTHRGVVIAIGWSGQWEARVERFASTPPSPTQPDTRGPNPGLASLRSLDRLRIEAGMEGVHLVLHPGEAIRTPRILVVPWEGDRMRGQNLLRRYIATQVTPRLDGAPPPPPVFCNLGIADQEGGTIGAGYTFADLARQATALGVEYVILDAGWFTIPPHGQQGAETSWLHGVGNYSVREDLFPKGLRPLADIVRKEGRGFGLWFEPERVCVETRVFQEHRDWLFPLPLKHGYNLNFGNPEARQWVTDTISRMIDEVGITWYRHDANANYLPVWQANDPLDRQGISEIRQVEGLYRFWADLIARHPGLHVEGCASGGRRMDFEALRYHHSETCTDWLWGDPVGMQCIVHGGSQWLPPTCFNLWMGIQGAPSADSAEQRYGFFSTIGGGINAGWRWFNGKTPVDAQLGLRWLEEFKSLRWLAQGDFYPILPYSLSEGTWLASQYDRPEHGDGMILAFRRRFCTCPTVPLHPQALEAGALYRITFQSTGEERRVRGRDLRAGLEVRLDAAPANEVIRYCLVR